ncbi:MAG TPA: SGNH/GDSL hydrolase family protein [Arthrobacter sp.]|nr:SGNH/GDSL hydrolase family protein [Arthrobacter sp.]
MRTALGPVAPNRRRALPGVAAVIAVSSALVLSGCGLPAQSAGGPSMAGAGPAFSRVLNPGNGRPEALVPEIGSTVLLIGDSQSEPADGWPRLGLAAAGYRVYFCGKGGTGFVLSKDDTGNYIDALLRGDWLLPTGTPALIVVQGGGNDATGGASDSDIVTNAERLIGELQKRYPGTRIAMIGTLARGEGHGGGRRSEVDALLGSVASDHGLPFVSVGDWLTRYGLVKDLADSVHMNPEGHRALGTLLGGRLRELGLERKPTADDAPLLDARTGDAGVGRD